MLCWQDPLCSAHALCIPAERAINNAASRHDRDGRVCGGQRSPAVEPKSFVYFLTQKSFAGKFISIVVVVIFA